MDDGRFVVGGFRFGRGRLGGASQMPAFEGIQTPATAKLVQDMKMTGAVVPAQATARKLDLRAPEVEEGVLSEIVVQVPLHRGGCLAAQFGLGA